MSADKISADGIEWNLTDLYQSKNDPQIIADIETALKQAEAFAEKYRGRLASGKMTPEELFKAVAEYESIQERMAKTESFAMLLYSTDTLDHDRGALVQMTMEKTSEMKNMLVFFELEWLSLSDEKAKEYYEHSALAKYKHFLEAWRRFKPYKLSEKEEQLMEAISNTGRKAFIRLFDESMGAMEVKVVLNDEEKTMPLAKALSFLYDPNKDTRKAAAKGITDALKNNEKLLTFIFNTLVQDHATTGKFRNYASPMEPRNLENELDQKTVDALLNACDKNMEMVARYYKLKARLLGLEKLYDYDRYSPLPGEMPSITYADSRDKVLKAYNAFSPEMAEIAKMFFDGNWIDAQVKKGKSSGAFSASTVPTVHPYVFLNFADKVRDMMTMAHELGHGVHQYLSRANGYLQMDTPLVTAETASVFGEMLVFEDILRETSDPRTKLTVVASKIEDFFATVFRQAIMTRFEQMLHRARVKEGELSSKRINELWMETNSRMFGDSVELRDDYGYWWSYVMHFVHFPFYCYAYSFGLLLVLALYAKYRKEGSGFVPKYLELLKTGGSLSPKDLIAKMGVDITDPNFWQGGLDMLGDYVNMAEDLAAEVGY
jgi:oligoendopeptidase F